MKKILILTILAAAVLAVQCSEESESFYTVTYTISSSEASVDLSDTSADDPLNSPLEKQIEEQIEASSWAMVGGSYTLSFTRFDGGILVVRRTADAEPETGTFDKTPGADITTFHLGGKSLEVNIAPYKSDGKLTYMLTSNHLEYYKELYPEVTIRSARLVERAE